MDDTTKKPVHVQPVSRDTKFTKLRSLKCFEEVHQNIIDGWSPAEVAKLIQDEHKEYTDITRPSLVNVIKSYRSSLPPGVLIEKRMPAAFNAAAKKLQKSIDEVEELEWLTRFQKRRLKIDGATEKKINKLLPTMTQEVRAQVEVLRTLATVKMDLGVNKRNLGSIEVNATMVAGVVDKYGTSSVAKVLQDSASRQKVMGIAEKFLALAKHVPTEVEGEIVDGEAVSTADEPASEVETLPDATQDTAPTEPQTADHVDASPEPVSESKAVTDDSK